MNILVVDAADELSAQQKLDARNRVFYSLCRFQHKVNGATLHLHFDKETGRFNCTANVNVEGVGIVSVAMEGSSFVQVLTDTLEALGPMIATKLKWSKWFGADAVSNSIALFRELFGKLSNQLNSRLMGAAYQSSRVRGVSSRYKKRRIEQV